MRAAVKTMRTTVSTTRRFDHLSELVERTKGDVVPADHLDLIRADYAIVLVAG
jgi:hypothetical protein